MSENQKWNSALTKTGPKSVTHIYYDLDKFWSWLGPGFFLSMSKFILEYLTFLADNMNML